jgi:hypothetical protein
MKTPAPESPAPGELAKLLRMAGRYVGNSAIEGSLPIEIRCYQVADYLESPAPAPVDLENFTISELCDLIEEARTVAKAKQAKMQAACYCHRSQPCHYCVEGAHDDIPDALALRDIGTGSETSPDAGASIREALEEIANLCMAAHLVKRDAHKDAAAFSTIFTLARDALEAKPAEASEAEQIPHPVAEASDGGYEHSPGCTCRACRPDRYPNIPVPPTKKAI